MTKLIWETLYENSCVTHRDVAHSSDIGRGSMKACSTAESTNHRQLRYHIMLCAYRTDILYCCTAMLQSSIMNYIHFEWESNTCFALFSGAIFTEEQRDSSAELAFKYAVYRINKDKHILPRTTLVYDIQYVPRDDSFHASKKGRKRATVKLVLLMIVQASHSDLPHINTMRVRPKFECRSVAGTVSSPLTVAPTPGFVRCGAVRDDFARLL